MDPVLLRNLQLYMLVGMFALGGITFTIGVFILMFGVWGGDQHALLAQTSRIAQKGLAEELSGLVGNASTLLSTINDMVRTRNGIGMVLIVTGLVLMILPYVFTLILLK